MIQPAPSRRPGDSKEKLETRAFKSGRPSYGLQLSHLRRVLRLRARDALAALQLEHEEGESHRRELPVLFGVESAVRDPAVGVDGGRLVCSAGTRQGTPSDGAPCLDAALGGGELGDTRILQVRAVPARQLHR